MQIVRLLHQEDEGVHWYFSVLPSLPLSIASLSSQLSQEVFTAGAPFALKAGWSRVTGEGSRGP